VSTSGSHQPLQAEYEKFLPADLAASLVEQYDRLKKRARAGDHEGVQETSGKVAEHILRATQHLAGQAYIPIRTEIRNMQRETQALEGLPAAQVNDSIRIVLPRMVAALYTLRNKRRGGHTASEVDPGQADALTAERMADWMMAEVFRLGNNMPPDRAEAVIASLVQRRIPVVFASGTYRRVLRPDLEPEQELMVLLYGEAAGATMADLMAWSGFPRTSLGRYVNSLEEQRLVRSERGGAGKRVFLLPTGERRVEDAGWLGQTSRTGS
jgi:hypothetical protein